LGQWWTGSASFGAESMKRALIGTAVATAVAVGLIAAAIALADPTVTISTPANGSATNDSTPTFSGTAAADVTVKVYSGTDTHGSLADGPLRASIDAEGNWSVDADTPLADGVYTVSADGGTTANSTFTVDTAAPGVTLTAPADGSRTSDDTPTLSGEAGNAAGDSDTVTVKIYAGSSASGSPVQTLTPTRSGATWSDTAAPLPDGTYTAQAEQTDDAGNMGTSAADTFAVDTIGPALTFTAPGDGGFTNDDTPLLSGAIGTATGDFASVSVTIDGGTPNEQTPGANLLAGQWFALPYIPLSEGPHTLKLEQSDDAGNKTTLNAAFTVDMTAPSIALVSPADNAVTGSTPTVSGTTSDPATVTVHVLKGGSTVQTLAASPSGMSWSVATGVLAPGNYSTYAEVTDAAGNHAQTISHAFRVNAPPVASFVANPASPQVGDTVVFSSTSQDLDGALASIAWDLNGDGRYDDATGSVVSHSFATRGVHAVGVLVTDADGATAFAIGTVQVRPRAVAPTLLSPFPIVRIAGHLAGRGVQLRLLSALAPVGSHVEVRCSGKACPRKRVSRSARARKAGQTTRLVSFPEFEVRIPAGVVIEVRVTKPGRIGKYTRFVISRGKAPRRTDRCLMPGRSKPVACPSS
jgi:methionine-rich copper-binding protein CopC